MTADISIQDAAHPGHVFFTASQIRLFYKRIGLPQEHCHEPGRIGTQAASAQIAQDPVQGVHFLSALIKHTLISIPFENFSMHYAKPQKVTVAPDFLFDKMLQKSMPDGRPCGRGGYCMELNAIFLAVLRSVGFAAYPVAAHMHNQFIDASNPPYYKGATHQASIVTIDGTRYLVDVGCGPCAPTRPVPLNESASTPFDNGGRCSARLVRGPIPDTIDQAGVNAAVWTYELQRSPGEELGPCYCFGEVEALQADLHILNYFASTSPEFWLRDAIVAIRFLTNDAGDIDGLYLLHTNVLKRRMSGKAETIATFKTEEERLKAFEEYFGVLLTDEERSGILGTHMALESSK